LLLLLGVGWGTGEQQEAQCQSEEGQSASDAHTRRHDEAGEGQMGWGVRRRAATHQQPTPLLPTADADGRGQSEKTDKLSKQLHGNNV
jgi:hypothetical protein